MSRQASSDRVASACDSYFHLPAKGSTSPNGVGSRSISGVRLDATQDPALLPPSPLDLPPSSSSLAASRATTQIQVSSRG
ncbi:hypothetical protein GLOTRDRAFT_111595 [Gloeophyllum trabeum ATCC 11539]|uniref:Uncharacterized protein n=1 Tax=Gloeophyllum trabeum (strain ATCC 11539 / FP-39264 / Madison 617) TaxID=670483 RepID=S7Q442_GLOTA|nr:uncharacterized protein GLOTRDRAFT_111595 [Gloeophyllum trabeum ATCC 11539]EPQ54238.1 hypothetical protein GLOTRDRAFT_111595 [Gloeophyllum trabeum ATCC 11539]